MIFLGIAVSVAIWVLIEYWRQLPKPRRVPRQCMALFCYRLSPTVLKQRWCSLAADHEGHHHDATGAGFIWPRNPYLRQRILQPGPRGQFIDFPMPNQRSKEEWLNEVNQQIEQNVSPYPGGSDS